MRGKKKVIFLTIVFVIASQILIANAIGLNIGDLVRQKTESIAIGTTQNTSDVLEQAKQEALAETEQYVNEYIDEVQNILEQYANAETEAAKIKIKAKSKQVKDALDATKEDEIKNGKTKIKIKIDKKAEDILSELDEQISIKIQQKFSN